MFFKKEQIPAKENYIFISQVLSYLILAILILRSINPLRYDFVDTMVATLIFVVLVIIVFGTKILNKSDYYLLEVLSNLLFVLVTSYFLISEQENIFKLLFLMPVVITALKYGFVQAFLSAFFSIAALYIVGSYHQFVFIDADIVLSIIILLLAWLLGHMTETENNIRNKLQATNDYMSGILNKLPVGVLTVDKELRVSLVNATIKELLDYEGEDLLGLTIKDLAEKFYGQNHKILIEKIIEGTETSIEEIKEIRKKYGSKVKLKISVMQLGHDFICLFEDVKKQQELYNLQLQTETILNAINNPVLILDTDNKILRCNKAFEDIVEMAIQEFAGMDIKELNRIIRCSLKDTLNPLELKGNQEISIIAPKSGTKKELLWHYSPIFNIDGETIGCIGAGSDITLKKIKDRELQQKEKLALLGQMAAGIVHEIKNPLTTIKGFSQFLVTRTADNNLIEHLRIIEREADEVNKVVSDFLAFAKPHPPALEDISLNQLLQTINNLIDNHLFINGIKLVLDFAQEETKVMVDKNQIRQVILNIIHNAIDAMAQTQEPCLTITTGYNSLLDEGFIKITNNGEPMSQDQIEKVGTPFFTTKESGTGLGLSICYQIVKEHRGRIDIESDAIAGTSFIIFLPTKNKAAQTADTSGRVEK